jgi:S-adenosylmethionine:tRNA ribosyltransferase-isomerase
MRTDLFDFELPEDRIALHPASPRDAARLLVVRPAIWAPSPRPSPQRGEGEVNAEVRVFTSLERDQDARSLPSPHSTSPRRGEVAADVLAAAGEGAYGLEDRIVRELPQLLRPGDALIFNDTRVIPAALEGVRRRGELEAHISVTLIERLDQSRWRTLARPAKRLKEGDRLHFGHDESVCLAGALDATVAERGEDGEVTLAFDLGGADLDAAIASVGRMPLPPYIAGRRAAEDADRRDYQTIYAAHDGAVAAPTAGLHFTPELMAALDARGISRHFVTLHVGAGTFLPVKAEDTGAHKMHAEWGEVTGATAAALNAARAAGGRLVAVGTTSLRLIESAAAAGEIQPFRGPTDIFITPGYRFRAIDTLMTNFHLPRSTLFMLVSAFSGLDVVKAAYAHALASGYRFYSYGDACLLFPSQQQKG